MKSMEKERANAGNQYGWILQCIEITSKLVDSILNWNISYTYLQHVCQ